MERDLLEYLLTVSGRMAETRSLDPLLVYVVDEAIRLVGAERGYIVLVRADGSLDFRVTRNPDGLPPGHVEDQISHSVLQQVVDTGKPLVLRDATQDAVFGQSESVVILGLRSILCVPLVSKAETIGAIYVENRSIRARFSEEDLAPLALFANQAAIAIENAALNEHLESQVKARTIDLETTNKQLQAEIGERKRAQGELKAYSEHLEDRIDERTKELHEAQKQLIRQEKLAVLGKLAGSVGHELRNPLAVMANAVYVLQLLLPEANDEVQEYLQILDSRVHEAGKIVGDLLDFSRIRSAEKEDLPVIDLVNTVLSQYPPPDRVWVTKTLPKDLPYVYVDGQHIRQVLINLVSNAYHAMPDGGSLTFRANGGQRQVRLMVEDSGVGMSTETLTKIFEPLYTTKPRGIGLGLAVSKSLIEVNDGQLEVDSVEAQGSTFTLTLPVREE